MEFLKIDKINIKKIAEYKSFINEGNIIIIKNYINNAIVQEIKKYLTRVGRSSIPNYCKIEKGAPNFHRINNNDDRAYVKGCFHQFVFFPWNQDYFDLFKLLEPAYRFKNLLSDLDKDYSLVENSIDDCCARIAIQHYPSGKGHLNRHQDPVDYHQLVVPILIMSKKGVDYETGGLFVESDNKKVYLDDLCEVGDVVYFKADCIHGVDMIDKETKNTQWLDFKGRWMGLLAVNKFHDNNEIGNSKDLKS